MKQVASSRNSIKTRNFQIVAFDLLNVRFLLLCLMNHSEIRKQKILFKMCTVILIKTLACFVKNKE